ncbi:MAG: ATP-binding protein [Francisella endosymbiont of Hyalomma asiaticum]
MLASRLNSILPPLDKKEVLSSAMIASIKVESGIAESFYKRSFRHPHHTPSVVSLWLVVVVIQCLARFLWHSMA